VSPNLREAKVQLRNQLKEELPQNKAAVKVEYRTSTDLVTDAVYHTPIVPCV